MQNNPFKRKPGFSTGRESFTSKKNWGNKNSKHVYNKKEKDWGAQKFTPVVRPSQATPWASFKNEIIQKQQEKINEAKNMDMESEEAKQFLKEREEKFRCMQIIESKNEQTEWENFDEDLDMSELSQTNGEKTSKSGKRFLNTKNGKKTRGQTSLIDEGLLKNFDSKKLNFHQNNKIRRIITKTTHLARGNSLQSVVNHLKREGLVQKNIKKC